MVQYAKFGKMAMETTWRKSIGSLNYIETSTWTRQEHNGFSHQNPSFIGAVLNLKPTAARVYFPPDANCFLSTLAHCLRSMNYVNLMVGSKQPSRVFLTPKEAEAHCRAGTSVWPFASIEGGLNPDVVLVGIGTELTFEVVKAAELLRELVAELRVRVVNVTDLMVLETEGTHPHALNDQDFDSVFTDDRAIHFKYHGYDTELKGLLFARPKTDRMTIESYREEGSTTTPFDMMLLNHVSRYHVMEYALRGGAKVNEKVRMRLVPLLADVKHRIQKTREYIMSEGKDPEGTYDLGSHKGSGGGVLSEG
jgi:xylulose-5-phosphate/fructose-6-phosphate phosphoketolase